MITVVPLLRIFFTSSHKLLLACGSSPVVGSSRKIIFGSLINVVAAILFISAGLVDWPKAGVMTIGAITGYFLGAHYSQRISQRAVRILITIIGFAISAWTFYEQFVATHK